MSYTRLKKIQRKIKLIDSEIESILKEMKFNQRGNGYFDSAMSYAKSALGYNTFDIELHSDIKAAIEKYGLNGGKAYNRALDVAMAVQPEAIEHLVKSGADVNAVDESEWTYLHIASEDPSANMKNIEALIKSGADFGFEG